MAPELTELTMEEMFNIRSLNIREDLRIFRRLAHRSADRPENREEAEEESR